MSHEKILQNDNINDEIFNFAETNEKNKLQNFPNNIYFINLRI
jgi:hypothetical protein